MRKIVSLVVLLGAMTTWADPVSIKLKSGLLIKNDDTYVEVDAGLYMNEEARLATLESILAMDAQNKSLIAQLESANKKLTECDAYIPGFPSWLGVVLSVALTAASVAIGVFAAREAGAK